MDADFDDGDRLSLLDVVAWMDQDLLDAPIIWSGHGNPVAKHEAVRVEEQAAAREEIEREAPQTGEEADEHHDPTQATPGHCACAKLSGGAGGGRRKCRHHRPPELRAAAPCRWDPSRRSIRARRSAI